MAAQEIFFTMVLLEQDAERETLKLFFLDFHLTYREKGISMP